MAAAELFEGEGLGEILGGDEGGAAGEEAVGDVVLDGTEALKEVGGGAFGVAIVVEEGVLGGEAPGLAVEALDLLGGHDECFEEGDLAVLVDVGGGVGHGSGEGLAEAGVVLL